MGLYKGLFKGYLGDLLGGHLRIIQRLTLVKGYLGLFRELHKAYLKTS
jgi:hypothetical protein